MRPAIFSALATILFGCSLQSDNSAWIEVDVFEPVEVDPLSLRTGLYTCVARCLGLGATSGGGLGDSPCSCDYNATDGQRANLGLSEEAVKLATGCYLFLEESLEWRSAVQLCASRGFRLASLETRAEMDVVARHLVAGLEEDMTFKVWTSGLVIPPDRRKWLSSGCEIDSSTWRKQPKSASTEPSTHDPRAEEEPDLPDGEPSTHESKPKEAGCVIFEEGAGGLGEAACDSIAGVVCEWAAPDEMARLTTGDYLLMDGQMTWDEASAKCSSRGLQLVSVNSDEELLALSELVTRAKGDCAYYAWSGGRATKGGNHVWSGSGTRVRKGAWWQQGQPDLGRGSGTRENCLALQRVAEGLEEGLLLNDLSCEAALNAICERGA